MKQTNEKVYRCDHCNKAMVSAGFMKLHERMCKENPNNQHKCFQYCEHLVRDQYDITDDEGHKCGSSEVTFTCAKKSDIELFSYKLERYKSNELRRKGMTRMPLECDLYETMDGHYYGDEPEGFFDVDNVYEKFFDL